MNNFSYLPFELYTEIFKHLSLNDLDNLHKVSIRFENVINEYKLKKLIVNNEYRRAHSWLRSDILCDSVGSTADDFVRIKSQLFSPFNFEINLLYLFINFIDFNDDAFVFNDLNNFVNLRHLEVIYGDVQSYLLLDLENCKTLKFFARSFGEFKLTLLMPKLSFLSTSDLDNVRIVFDSPITQYEYFGFETFSKDLQTTILNILPHLETLFVYLDLNIYTVKQYNQLKNVIVDILNYKPTLKIYLQNVRLDVYEDRSAILNDFMLSWNSDYEEITEFQIENFKKLNHNLDKYKKLNYSIFRTQITLNDDQFLRKFFNIRFLVANDLYEDDKRFNCFLSKLVYLRNLNLIDCDLNQSFYDSMPILNYLEEINIRGSSNKEINLDFVLRFKNLKLFYTNSQISYDDCNSFNDGTINCTKFICDRISNYFNNLRALSLFEFKLTDCEFVEIFKVSRLDKYLLNFYSLSSKRFQLHKSRFDIENLNELEDKLLKTYDSLYNQSMICNDVIEY